MSKKVVLITGCSRGVGLGLVQAFHDLGYQVIASCRSPAKADDLRLKLQELGQPEALALDITSDESIDQVIDQVKEKYGSVDALINNAGVATKNHPHDPPGQIEREEMTRVYTTNVVSTCMFTQKMLPLIRSKDGATNGKVLYISSFLGSISGNTPKETNFYMATSYRCTKSAMNQLVKCFSHTLPEEGSDAKRVFHLSVSPGHVQTDMGNANNRSAPLTVDFVAPKIAGLVDKLDEKLNGGFVDYAGTVLPY